MKKIEIDCNDLGYHYIDWNDKRHSYGKSGYFMTQCGIQYTFSVSEEYTLKCKSRCNLCKLK